MAAAKVVIEERVVGKFDKIELLDYGTAYITQAPQETLVIEADPDLLPDIRSKVVDNTLVLRVRQNWFNKLFNFAQSIGKIPIVYRISLKQLKAITISGKYEVFAEAIDTDSLSTRSSGVSKFQIDSIQAEQLIVKISGRSEIGANGRATNLRVQINGSGECQASELECRHVRVGISGQGTANVWAKEILDVNITGHGLVKYKGEAIVSQKISGAGSVSQVSD